MSEVPGWINAYIQTAREFFGVAGPDWFFKVKISDKPAGSAENAGNCRASSTYLNATIEIAEDAEPGEESASTIIHEVLHAPHQEINDIVMMFFDRLPPECRELAIPLYDAAVERFCQRVSRGLARSYAAFLELENVEE